MLNPIAMPKAPEAAAAQLSDALAVLAAEQSPVPRDAVIAAWIWYGPGRLRRRHPRTIDWPSTMRL